MLDTIPGPLRDRMEIISLAGYTDEEKLEIARRYLVRRQFEANGLKAGQVEIADDALREIIQDYTREAGVRNLEREIGKALRNAAVRIAEGRAGRAASRGTTSPQSSGAPQLRERGRDAHQRARRRDRPGLDAGRRRHPVHRGDALPGRQADPDRPARRRDEGERAGRAHDREEPRRIARHRREPLREERHPHPRAGRRDPEGRPERRRRDVHGAGLADDRPDDPQRHRDDRRDQPARPGAAGRRHQGKGRCRARAGITRVMLPARNRRDFEDIPEEVRKQLEFVWLERVEEAVAAALEPAAAADKSPPSAPQLADAVA